MQRTAKKRSQARAGAAKESGLTMKDLVLRILAKWPWLLVGLLIGLLYGLYAQWKAVPVYQSRARMLVREVRGSLETVREDEINYQSQTALKTIAQDLKRFDLYEKVAESPNVRNLKNLRPPPPKKLVDLFQSDKDEKPKLAVEEEIPAVQLAAWLASWTSVNIERDTRFIDVMVTHPEREVAYVVANEIVDIYIDENSKLRQSGQKDKIEYLLAESENVRVRLQDARTTMSLYSSPLQAEEAYSEALQDFKQVEERYGPKHPKFLAAQQKLERSRTDIVQALERIVQSGKDKDYWEELAKEGAQIEDRLDVLRDHLVARKSVLESEVETQTTLYEQLLQQIDIRSISADQTESNIMLNDKARPAGGPINATGSSILVKYGLMGLLIGGGIAFLFVRLDNKLYVVTDVEKHFAVPVLAAIERVDPKVISQIKEKEPDEMFEDPRAAWSDKLIFRDEFKNTHYAEMFRVLRTSVALLNPNKEHAITMVTSALPAEGKTTVASNLALAIASNGTKTLLLDFDLRRPSIHTLFGKARDKKKGLVDLMSGLARLDEVTATEVGLKNFKYILSGRQLPNPGELLGSDQVGKLLAWLSRKYEHIVIDTAPLLAVSDSRIIAPYVDNFCLVVRADSTPIGAVKRALDILDADGIQPDGIVFNDYLESRLQVEKNYSYGYYGTSRRGRLNYGVYGEVYGAKNADSEKKKK